jgi:hypothetical protein
MKVYWQPLMKKITRTSRDKMETLYTGKFTLGVLSEENHEKLWLVKEILFTDNGRKHLLALLSEEIRENSMR